MTPIGRVVADRYEVVRHIGRGGMQEVFYAKDVVLDLGVALKTPQAGQAVGRFKKSAIISAMVNHHNIAKTLDYVEENGEFFLIEEYVAGETLDAKLKKFGLLDPHLAAHVFHHLAKGVQASHRVDVVHRDLKPSNVMVSNGVNVHELKITDFGIATLTKKVFEDVKKQGDMTNSTSGTVKGALPYMAPEMMFDVDGCVPGKPVDVWSLGAMMFQLLTGEVPFGVYLDAAVNVKNQHRKPWPSFMTSNAQFKPLAIELQKAVESCLSYDASKRPTADQLVDVCQKMCYLAMDREQGEVYNLIQNGYSGFAKNAEGDVFFSMESVYGPKKPDTGNNSYVCFSSFSGKPRNRAHPILVIKPD